MNGWDVVDVLVTVGCFASHFVLEVVVVFALFEGVVVVALVTVVVAVVVR